MAVDPTKRTCSGTGYDVGATVPKSVERRANVLGRFAPSRSRGLSAAPPTEVGGLGLEFRD